MTKHAHTHEILTQFPGGSAVKTLPAMGQEDPLEKRMTTHSSILTWRIPWLEESGGLQSMAWGHKELDMTEQLTPLLLLLSRFSRVQLCATP